VHKFSATLTPSVRAAWVTRIHFQVAIILRHLAPAACREGIRKRW
jgi:hypothetical protein